MTRCSSNASPRGVRQQVAHGGALRPGRLVELDRALLVGDQHRVRRQRLRHRGQREPPVRRAADPATAPSARTTAAARRGTGQFSINARLCMPSSVLARPAALAWSALQPPGVEDMTVIDSTPTTSHPLHRRVRGPTTRPPPARRTGPLHHQRGRGLDGTHRPHPALVRAHRPHAARRPLRHRAAAVHQPGPGLARPRRQAAADRHVRRRDGALRRPRTPGRAHLRRTPRTPGSHPQGRAFPHRGTAGHLAVLDYKIGIYSGAGRAPERRDA